MAETNSGNILSADDLLGLDVDLALEKLDREEKTARAKRPGFFQEAGRQLVDVPFTHLPAAVAAAVEGSDIAPRGSITDKLIERSRKASAAYAAEPGAGDPLLFGAFSREDVRGLGPSLGFSGAGALAGVGAGLPAAAVATPVAGWAAGGAASYKAASNMSASQFLRDVRDKLEKERGVALSDSEWATIAPQYSEMADRYRTAEALPETLSNLAQMAILVSPAGRFVPKSMVGAVNKNLVTKGATKLAAMTAAELPSEVVTQQFQQPAQVQAGLQEGPERSLTSGTDWLQSLKEVAGPVALQTMIMGGVGGAGVKGYRALQGRDKLLNDTAEAVIAQDRLNQKLEAEARQAKQEKINDRKNQRATAGKTPAETAPAAAEETGAPGQAVLAEALSTAALAEAEKKAQQAATRERWLAKKAAVEAARQAQAIASETGVEKQAISGKNAANNPVVLSGQLPIITAETPVQPAPPERENVGIYEKVSTVSSNTPESRQNAPGEAPPDLLQKTGVIPPATQESGQSRSEATVATRELWEMTRAEYRKTLSNPRDTVALGNHYQYVQNALSEGKSVPAAVLSDYPDLVQKSPETKASIQSPNPGSERPAGKILGADVRGLSDANIAKFAKSKNKRVSDLAKAEQGWRAANVVTRETPVETAKPAPLVSDPSKQPHMMTRAAFIEAAKSSFVREKGKRNIDGVRWNNSLYMLKDGEQRNGRLTKTPEEILGRIHREQIEQYAKQKRSDVVDAEQAPYPGLRDMAKRRIEAKQYPSDEVLADYPDLTKPAPIAEAAPTPTPPISAPAEPSQPTNKPEPGYVYGVDKNGRINRFSPDDSVSSQMAARGGWRIFDTREEAQQSAGKPATTIADHLEAAAKLMRAAEKPANQAINIADEGLARKREQLAELEQQINDAPNTVTRNMLEGRALGLREQIEKLQTARDQVAQPNPEARSNTPEAESQAPGNREAEPGPSDAGVAPGQGVAVPDAAEQAPQAKEGAKNIDVGENLWYNRRNFTGKAIGWNDIKGLNDTLKVRETIKTKVWPRPDYEQLVAEGLQPFFARLLKQVYDGIAVSPNTHGTPTDDDLQRYIKVVNSVRDAVFEWAKDSQANREFLESAMGTMRPGQTGPIAISDLMKRPSFVQVLLDRVWPETKDQSSYGKFRQGSEAQIDIRIIGGNRALQTLQFTKGDLVKAVKDVQAGWPKAQEAWQRQGFTVSERDKALAVRKQAQPGERVPIWIAEVNGRTQAYSPDEASVRDAVAAFGQWLVQNKRGKVLAWADTQEEAQQKARDLTQRDTKGGDLRGMNIEESERAGPDRRAADENVTSDRLMHEFGFRGVNFGRQGWINQNERQAYLNHAYDSLLDLAELLNVPPTALSLNGMLGIAFGAQGRGGQNAAHFVPGVNEINLTKTKGAGTLAHEWGHALDHYFAGQAGLPRAINPFLSENLKTGPESTIRPEIIAAFKSIVNAMVRRNLTPEEDAAGRASWRAKAEKQLDGWIKKFRNDLTGEGRAGMPGHAISDRAALLAEFDQLTERMRRGDLGDGYVKAGKKQFTPVIAQVRNLVHDATGRMASLDDINALENNATWLRGLLAQKEAERAHIPQTTSTTYQRESVSKDKEKGGKKYWSTEREMFARAFETYVADRLVEREQVNTFLSDAALRAETPNREGTGFASPYPRGEDRKTINTAIDKLVREIKTLETDKSVAMYSLGEPGPSLPAADIRAHIAGITDKLAIPVTVYDNVAAALADGVTVPDDARGFAAKGRIGLITENIKTRLEAETTLWHEVQHVGIRAIAKRAKDANAAFANYNAALTRVAMANPEVRRRAKAWRDKYGAEKTEQFRAAGIEDALEARVRLSSFDEAVADLAGERRGKPIARLNELIAALQRLVRALGFNELAAWMEEHTDAEVLSLIRSATQAVSKGVVSFGGELVPSYAQGDGRQNLADRIDAVLQGGHNPIPIYLGETPAVLRRLGASQLPMGMGEDVADKSLFDHGVSSREMKALADAIADPVAVVDSEAKNAPVDSLVVITDLVKSDGRPIIVAVHPEQLLDRTEANSVASVYPKDNAKQTVARWLATKLRYVNNEKRPEWQRFTGVQFPRKIPAPGAGKIVLSEKEFVKGDFVAVWGKDPFQAAAKLPPTIIDDGPESYSRLDQTGTAAFRAWFKDSVVTDTGKSMSEGGKPLTVYHGTDASFNKFVLARTGQARNTRYGKGAFFFTDNPQAASSYAGQEWEWNDYTRANVMPVYVSLQNPLVVDAEGMGWSDVDQDAIRQARREGHDGVIFKNVADFASADDLKLGTITTYVAFKPTQIKSAIGNRGTFDPGDPNIMHSRGSAPISAPDWVQAQSADMQETLRKAGAWRPKQTIQDRIAGWTENWQAKLRQGMVDQFDPIKSLDYHAYMLARMTKSAAGPLEAALFDGTVYLDKDGAVDLNYEKGGFIGKMQALKGEHDRFFSWVIGNRAARLMEEGKEHNFTKDDIARLKTLNQGDMADGSHRNAVYLKALSDLNRYNKSILDIAEKAGLVDGESRPFWERDFYIPFYRMTEGDTTKGPVKSGGLVRQYAFKTLKGGEQAIGDPMENILKNWAHLIDASLKNQAAVASLDAAVKVGVARETTADEKGAVFVMKNGQKTYYAVDDPFVLDAINSLGFSGFSGPAMKVMSSFKRWLTYGVTISPAFRIRNVIRDSISMIGVNPASYNVLDNVLTGWKLTAEDSPAYASMIAGGGVIRFGTLETESAANIKRLVDAGVDSGTILDSPAKVKAMLKTAYDWWMRMGDRSENMNRAALYQKLRDEGRSHLEASYAARDTMDFSMQGTWSAIRFLAQTVPFFNARLEGMYKLGRGAVEDPRRFSYVVGGAALASIALLLAYQDDDDWKQREDFDRETYWWFKIGDTAFRIPKPFEIGALATVAERGLEAMITDDLTGKQFAKRIGAIVGQQLSMNPVPQLFMPMIETWANRDAFTGRPIESMGMDRLSSSERISPYTSAFAQLVGKNGVVSPVQIDHLVAGYFGWLGTHAVATADLALRPVMGLPEKPAMRIDDVFTIGDFARSMPAYQSKYVTHLYEQGKEVQEAMADLRAAQKIGATEKAAEILQDRGDKIRLYRLYTHAEKQLSQINSQIKMVQRREGDADMKRARLDQLYVQRNRIAKITGERAQATQR